MSVPTELEPLPDIEIARRAELRPITEVGAELGLGPEDLEPYGHHVAKLPPGAFAGPERETGELVVVTGTSPTPPGEGKTTVSVGLADGLRRRCRRPVLCLREPSLGPTFGRKGGAAGGGRSQVLPMEEINLHFTGDFHAITSAHSLLSAMLDNELHRGNGPGLDPRKVTWRRVLDMNDRALRHVVVGLGGATSGVPREEGFMITAASELMAILCLAADLPDLEARIGRIIVGYTADDAPVRAADLGAPGAMTMLLRKAMMPNLVQTMEGTPALVHGGPFGNIAHGCNSLAATRAGLALGDVVVTEAGFGTELGAEKFFDIKARLGGLRPGVAVVVTTARALKMHGGVALDRLEEEDPEAVRRGLPNLEKHLENVGRFGVPAVVAVNRFRADTERELAVILDACRARGVPAAIAEGHLRGGEGMLELADRVIDSLEARDSRFAPLYGPEAGLGEKIERIAREMYGADGVDYSPGAEEDLDRLEALGLGRLLVCMAKTPFSLSDDATKLGRPEGFRITVRGVSPSAGAGFVVVRTGKVLVMPGLPARPAALDMGVRPGGEVVGLS